MPFDKISHLILGLSFVCIVLTLVAISAQADEPNLPQPEPIPAGKEAIMDPVHELIKKQLEAINSRDADLAYSMISNNFHEKFDTAKEFLSHMRLKLRPIYNHGDYKFLEQSGTQDGLIQKVLMEDRYGDPVTVIYRLQRQGNGDLLIDSFAILALEAEPI